jgi:hypothetical protein
MAKLLIVLAVLAMKLLQKATHLSWNLRVCLEKWGNWEK